MTLKIFEAGEVLTAEDLNLQFQLIVNNNHVNTLNSTPQYTFSNTVTFGNTSVNTVINSTSLSVNNIISGTLVFGNTTANTITVGNSTVNTVINSTSISVNNFTSNTITVGNSTVNTVINSTSISVNNFTSNTVTVGNSTINLTSFTIGTNFIANASTISINGLTLLKHTSDKNISIPTGYSTTVAKRFTVSSGNTVTIQDDAWMIVVSQI